MNNGAGQPQSLLHTARQASNDAISFVTQIYQVQNLVDAAGALFTFEAIKPSKII